jgi:hypothetical protein
MLRATASARASTRERVAKPTIYASDRASIV